jgi:hypothetical protein
MLTLLIAMVTSSHATEIGRGRPFGLGIQLGAPTGITGKVYLGGRSNALDFTFGGAYVDRYWWGGIWAQVAYHWHISELTRGNGVTIPFRVGVGGFLATSYYDWGWRGGYGGDAVIGARVPVGLDFDLEDAPVQFYVEVAVDVTVLPPLGVGVDGGIGVRYYF